MPETHPQRRFGLWPLALVLIGLLILIPSGLCTAVFGVAAVSDRTGMLSNLLMVLLVGGPVIAIGAVMIYAGVKLFREKK